MNTLTMMSLNRLRKLFVLLTVLLLAACGGEGDPALPGGGNADIVTVTSVNIEESGIDIPLGGGYGLSVEVTYIDSDGFARTTNIPSVLSWYSSNDTIVSVTDNGVVNGLQADAIGQTITATLGGVSDTVNVTVTDKALSTLEVKPTNTYLPLVGMSQQMQAIAHFDDMTTLNVTSQTEWSDDDLMDATIQLSSQGVATAVADGGPVTITGTYSGQNHDASLTVGNPNVSVRQIDLTPADLDIAKGLTQRYRAIATLDDFSTVDITSLATWSVDKDSSGTTVASFGSGANIGELSALEESDSTVNVTAELHGVEGVGTLDVTNARLDSVVIDPTLKRTVVGAPPFLYAVYGTFSDGSSEDVTGETTFTSSNPSVMEFIGGKYANPKMVGVSKITASTTVNGITQTAQALYEVTNEVLSVQDLRTEPSSLTLPLGGSAAIQVIATLNTQAEHDVTSLINTTDWSSSDPYVAYKAAADTYTIETGDTTGTADLTVNFAGQSATLAVTTNAAALESITLDPISQALAQGMTGQDYDVTGHYTDGTMSPLDNTTDLNWSSSDGEVTVVDGGVTVSSTATPGTPVTITAIDEHGSGITGQAVVNVIPAQVTQLDITPLSDTMVEGGRKAMTATATLSNGSTLDVSSLVDWTVDSTYLSVNGKGVITAISTTGTPTKINASLPNGGLDASQEAEMTITAASTINLSVVPKNVTLAKGMTKQYVAWGAMSNGQNAPIQANWATGDTSIAEISTQGVLTARAVGTTTVTATDPQNTSMQATTSVTVSQAQVDPSTLTLSPSTVTVQVGKVAQTTAEVTLTDGTTVVDVTDNISLNVTPGTGNAQGLEDGWIHGTATGDASAIASLGTANSNSIDITINPAVNLDRIEVSPQTQQIEESTTGQPLVVTAYYDDNTDVDVSNQASFHDPKGLVTFTDNVPTALTTLGTTTVNIVYTEGNITKTTTAGITVTAGIAPPDGLRIEPATKLMQVGTTHDFKVYGTYNNGAPEVDLTGQATLVDKNGSRTVTIDESTGKVTADAEGNTILEAAYSALTSQSYLETLSAIPLDGCQVNGVAYSTLSDGTKVLCPLTKGQADLMGLSYDVVIDSPTNPNILPSLVGLYAGDDQAAYCSSVTIEGLTWEAGTRDQYFQFTKEYNTGGIPLVGIVNGAMSWEYTDIPGQFILYVFMGADNGNFFFHNFDFTRGEFDIYGMVDSTNLGNNNGQPFCVSTP